MPVKHVYGKRARKAGAATSAFAWSSADTSPSAGTTKTTSPANPTAKDDPDTYLADTRTQGPRSTTTKRRLALRVRDSNSIVKTEILPPAVPENTDKAIRRSPRLKHRTHIPGKGCEANETSPTRQSCIIQPSLHSLRATPQLHQLPHDDEAHDGSKGQVPNPYDGEVVTDVHLQTLLSLRRDDVTGSGPMPFSTWTADLEAEFTVSKIAEASFAQVYLLERKIPTGVLHDDQSILKIISLNPVATNIGGEDERPPKVRDTSSDIAKVVSEVKLLDRMTEIPGFTNLRELNILSGQPSAPFVAAWKNWNKKRRKNEKSYFPDPSRKANYSHDQLWAVVEMDHAGLDLEHPDVKVDDVDSVWDVFWGVAITLAKGEEDVRFEHRDLHLGNVCVTKRQPVEAKQRRRRKLGASGLETTIIDYTLSRAEIEDLDTGTEAVCIDLAHEEVFAGDASENFQYEIYRYMRSVVYMDDPLGDFQNCADREASGFWLNAHLSTNVVWLQYLLQELGARVDFTDATKCIEGDEQPHVEPLTKEQILLHLCEQLSPRNWKSSDIRSASDLILTALERTWLDPEDVSGDTTEVESLIEGLSKLNLLKASSYQAWETAGADDLKLSKPQRDR